MTESERHLLVAHLAAANRVSAWVATLDAPVNGLRLVVGATERALPAAWQNYQAGGRTLRVQRVPLNGLAARSRHELRLVDRGQVVATASATTMPGYLPSPGERPFTLLLGSCFSVAQDPAGAAGATVSRLPAEARPELVVLTGDQVYLDSPALHFLKSTHKPDELAAEMIASYVSTWAQHGTVGGYRRLLGAASSVYCSDDHDFWNNAPNPAPYVRDTWTRGGRTAWLDAARRLFGLFQAEAAGATFNIGQMSVFVADTRFARAEDRSVFMPPTQLAALQAWVRGLRAPGALVTGQPIFTAETGWKGHFFDWSLPDFRQYRDLVAALSGTSHDILILTGDVHFGRVATCRLPNGRRLIEVIASPLALVHPFAAGKWSEAPSLFPTVAPPGVPQAPVTTEPYRRADDHFATLGFTGVGATVRVSVTSWGIQPALPPTGEVVYSTELH